MSYYQPPPYYANYDVASIKQQVMEMLFHGLLIAGIIMGIVAIRPPSAIVYLLALGVEIITMIGYFFAKKEATIEKLYYAFVCSSAVLLGYLLQIVASIQGGLAIIAYTFSLTALVVGGVYYRTSTRHVNTQALGRYLLPLGIAFIVVLIASMFFAFGYIGELLLSAAGAALFSLYLYWDFGRLMNGELRSPARMAWSLYWDIILVFRYILELLLLLSSNNN